MAKVDIRCAPKSLAGPVDPRVVRWFARHHQPLDPVFLRNVKKFHGGVPLKQYFDASDGKTYRVGRFLTLVDERTRLRPPMEESFEFDRDIRVDRSMYTLVDEEGPSCRQLFDALVPFAALYQGRLDPSEMSLLRAHCDLVCFDYSHPRRIRPAVVVWLAEESFKEYTRFEEDSDSEVRYQDFTVPVAETFEGFVAMLRPRR
jgi:hypothetical protein